MLRKALLSVIVVFAYPLGGQIQGLLAALVIVFGLYLHQVCAPFRKGLSCLNRYESIAVVIIVANTSFYVCLVVVVALWTSTCAELHLGTLRAILGAL